jgi:uncharacterized protein RhaS with RHS repeats
MTDYAVTVERVLPSDCVENQGAVDAVVRVHDDEGNSVGQGEVALSTDRAGNLVAYGRTREHWLSHGLVGLPDAALDEIVRAVRAVVRGK